MMCTKPAWMLKLLGPEATWASFQDITVGYMANAKLALYLMVMVVIWLTIWARKLSRN